MLFHFFTFGKGLVLNQGDFYITLTYYHRPFQIVNLRIASLNIACCFQMIILFTWYLMCGRLYADVGTVGITNRQIFQPIMKGYPLKNEYLYNGKNVPKSLTLFSHFRISLFNLRGIIIT